MITLKALELFGFKSFADRTRFEFPEGITVVVGPNGSGKSNVVDAIKWVLGEQSVRNLRGKASTDVIFAGSAARKALNAAEVSAEHGLEYGRDIDFGQLFRCADDQPADDGAGHRCEAAKDQHRERFVDQEGDDNRESDATGQDEQRSAHLYRRGSRRNLLVKVTTRQKSSCPAPRG